MSIGVGIAGWGAISELLHGPCLAGMEECAIVAVCDEREERLAHAADEYRCKGYTDLDAFFDHPGLDLVVIPLPNFLHGPTAVRAQAAGKHVISEKPMSFSPEEAEHLVMMGREKAWLSRRTRTGDGIRTTLRFGGFGKAGTWGNSI